MEPNQQPVPPVTPPAPTGTINPKHHNWVVIATLLAVILVGGYFAYVKAYIPWHQARVLEQKFEVLKNKIAQAHDGFVDLSMEEYDLLLSVPVTTPDVTGVKNTVGGVTVGYDDGDFMAAFQYVPNIASDGLVFVHFDSIKTKKGVEIFNKDSLFEEDDDMFTDLSFSHEIAADGRPYLVGSRSVRLTEDALDVKNSDIASVSGVLSFYLPVQASLVSFDKTEVGVTKPFADGSVTLTSMEGSTAAFTYTGSKNIYTYFGFDTEKNVLRDEGYTEEERKFELYFEDDVDSIQIVTADEIKKDYPFTIGAATAGK